ncbi:unnamed protein product, partial [Bubo scandiacus]
VFLKILKSNSGCQAELTPREYNKCTKLSKAMTEGSLCWSSLLLGGLQPMEGTHAEAV